MNCCVIGLGLFGYNLAVTLEKYGNKVIAIDSDMEAINMIHDKVTNALCLHVYNEDSLRASGIDKVDMVAVCMGKNFEESILITALLKKNFQIPMIVCRSLSIIHKEILELLGADYVILPEQEAGIKLADKLSMKYTNFNRITQEYSIVYVKPLKKWIDRTVEDIDFFSKYTITLLGKKQGEFIKSLESEYIICSEDTLVCAGENKYLEKITK